MSKKTKNFIVGLFCIAAAFLIFSMATYTTMENEYTVVKQFGKIMQINETPGLNIKVPLVQSVSSIPKSLQFYDLPKSEVITSDKKTMIVDAYILWRITDAREFTSSLNASTKAAEGRIDIIVYNAIKTTISNMTQEELIISRDDPIETANADAELNDVEIKDISAEEGAADTVGSEEEPEVIAISQELLNAIADKCDQYGIEIENIQIKILDLPDENKDAVYQRMITERNNIAAAYTAQGRSEAQVIKNTTDKEVSIMISEANAQAQKIIAEGEAEYMRILSEAYNDEAKADFYLYTLSLDAAKESLKNGKTTLFLDKDSPIAEIFQGTE